MGDNFGNSGKSDGDWRGFSDTTPPSRTGSDPNDAPPSPAPRSGDWRGMNDGTPCSSPKGPADE